MADKWLQEIREKIACSQFGDDHYGAWGSLPIDLRRSVKRMLDYIAGQEEYIEHQKAEIEGLKENEKLASDRAIEFANTTSISHLRYIDRLEKLYKCVSAELKTAKAEAIKEFAERLKEQIYIKKDKGLYFEKIDNLVKEMVGDV